VDVDERGGAMEAASRARRAAQTYEVIEMDVDVVEQIKSELASSPVVLFMKGTPDFPQCGFSAQTVAALRALGAEFRHVNIFEEPELREALKRYSNWPTYPQLYVKGELVGGCDIALEMYRNGELRKLLTEAGAAK
jgi:monothiol glutaredoxin